MRSTLKKNHFRRTISPLSADHPLPLPPPPTLIRTRVMHVSPEGWGGATAIQRRGGKGHDGDDDDDDDDDAAVAADGEDDEHLRR